MAIITDVKSENINKVKYPCLMILKKSTLIVLFSDDGEGVVVKEDDYSDIGHYGVEWNMSLFEPFNGTVTLENA